MVNYRRFAVAWVLSAAVGLGATQLFDLHGSAAVLVGLSAWFAIGTPLTPWWMKRREG